MNKYSEYVKTENIRNARKSKNLKVMDLAEKLGLSSRVSYYNIENGIVEPKISQIVIISEALGEPVENLFNI